MTLFITYLILFILGGCIGSYMDVVRSRGKWSLDLKSRSCCDKCKKVLGWKELIPFVSFISQRGKCCSCDCKIHWSCFASEVLMAVFFILSFVLASNGYEVLLFVGMSIFLVPLIIQDIVSFDVPDHLVYPLITFVSIWTAYINPEGFIYGFILAAPFVLLWIITRGKGIGLGDVFIAFPLGLTLSSFGNVVLVFFGSFIIGIIYIIILWIISGGKFKVERKTHIPLIPSIIVSYGLVIFGIVDFCTIYPNLCYI